MTGGLIRDVGRKAIGLKPAFGTRADFCPTSTGGMPVRATGSVGDWTTCRTSAEPVVVEYQPLPLDLVASLPDLPFPVYLQRDGRMVLYAMPGADLSGVATRTTAGLQVHVPAGNAAMMRRLLLVLFARALESRAVPVVDRGRQSADFAVALLSPVFGREPAIAPEAFSAAQAAVDLLSAALAVEPALGRAILGRHRSQPESAGAAAPDPGPGNSAAARRSAVRALDGLVCAMALATTLQPGSPVLDGLSLLELGRGVAFRDVGLVRGRSIAVRRRSTTVRPQSIADRVDAPLDRAHPWLGVRLIAEALGSTPSWTAVVAGHHERLDGTGYPAGRRGADLARTVRIAGLADTFAALVTPAAWGHIRTADEAIGVLRLGARARFGDDLVWGLVAVLESGQLLPLHRSGSVGATH